MAHLLLLAPFARAAATLTVLHPFSLVNGDFDYVEEGQGVNGLVLGRDGNFYGTAAGGGAGAIWNGGCGSIFRMTPDGTFTVLHSFSGSDGKSPGGGGRSDDLGPELVPGADGNFYGGTVSGGIGFNPDGVENPCNALPPTGDGTIFRITPDGSLTTLVFFNGTNGSRPSSLLQAKDGNFYGTTLGRFWGGDLYGTVFRMTPDGALTTLFAFDGTNGSSPRSLLQGKDGNFYGTMEYIGGAAPAPGGVFKMSPDGDATIFASFTDTNARVPFGLMQASDGSFYGTTSQGGVYSTYLGVPGGYFGTIFKVTPSGALSTLVKFTGGNGAWPVAALREGTDGNLYGATQNGGTKVTVPWVAYGGSLFQMTPQGKLTTLVFFNCRNGLEATGPLVQASDGSFYGTTFFFLTTSSFGPGEIFRLTVPGANAPKIISTAQSGSAVSLSWLALRGRSYQVQFTTDLTQTNWTNTGGPVTATNTSAAASDIIGADRQRFYRVALLP